MQQNINSIHAAWANLERELKDAASEKRGWKAAAARARKNLCAGKAAQGISQGVPAPKQTASNPKPLPVGRYAGHIYLTHV